MLITEWIPTKSGIDSTRRRSTGRAVVSLIALCSVVLVSGQSADAGIVPTVSLATAANYSVLGATTVTNTNPSVLAQSVGLSPGTSIVGFPPGIVNAPGTIEATSPVTLQAQNDLTAAYVDAAGRPVEFTQTNPDLVGQTLTPGVYAASAKAPLGLSGQLVLDGQNNPNAVFIFQTDSTLITTPAAPSLEWSSMRITLRLKIGAISSGVARSRWPLSGPQRSLVTQTWPPEELSMSIGSQQSAGSRCSFFVSGWWSRTKP